MMASALAACGAAISAAVSWLNRFTDAIPGSEMVIIVGFFVLTTGVLSVPVLAIPSKSRLRRNDTMQNFFYYIVIGLLFLIWLRLGDYR